jgi:hypothetical protein
MYHTRWSIIFGVKYTLQIALYHTHHLYKNLDGELFFSTNGCLCTLGISPRPIALRIALAIFLWFLGRNPVSLECFTRPISVMYSDIIVKFCRPNVSPRAQLASCSLPTRPHTLYSRIGFTPKTSKASCCGFLRPYFHFFCSVPLRSCGA